MAKEISGVSPSGTLYARVKNSAGLWWNGSSFEAYVSANYANYVITMTEEGNSGEYVANFPSGITSSGSYPYRVHRTLTTPAEGDPVVNTGTVDWTGSASVGSSTGAMTASDWRNYVLRQGFKRTDKDAELYECTTDAIQEMRRLFMFDEAEAEVTTTETITTLGEFKFTVEDDFGLLLGLVLEDDDTGTPLIHISKSEYDRLYASVNVETDRGYPEHFTIYAGQIYIGPIPDQTSYVYRLSYSRRAGTISATTTGVPFTDLYRDLLFENVMGRLYFMLEDFDKGNYYRSRFETKFPLALRRERINSGASCFVQKGFNL